MTFYDKFDKLCEENGKKKSPVCAELGLSKTAWAKWRDGATPDGKTVRKLADYFGVTYAFLLDDSLEDVPAQAEETDTAKIREAMRRRPGIKLLFDVLEDAPDSDLYETLALAQRLKEQSKNR